jgi:hypothetical protein
LIKKGAEKRLFSYLRLFHTHYYKKEGQSKTR